MISRIAKAFQDYSLNLITQKFGATIFTDGLKQAMRLPYQDFEDQRSGETLSILQKVRIDTEKFISSFIAIAGILYFTQSVSIPMPGLHNIAFSFIKSLSVNENNLTLSFKIFIFLNNLLSK